MTKPDIHRRRVTFNHYVKLQRFPLAILTFSALFYLLSGRYAYQPIYVIEPDFSFKLQCYLSIVFVIYHLNVKFFFRW